MKKFSRKLLSMLLCAAMLVSAFGGAAFADSAGIDEAETHVHDDDCADEACIEEHIHYSADIFDLGTANEDLTLSTARPTPGEEETLNDTTPPEALVSGEHVRSDGTYCLPVALTVSDNVGIASITVNGREQDPEFSYKYLLNYSFQITETDGTGQFTVVVTDLNNNQQTVTLTAAAHLPTNLRRVKYYPSCTAPGYQAMLSTCLYCGADTTWRYGYTEIPGHDYEEKTVKGCGEGTEVTVRICKTCGAVDENDCTGKENWHTLSAEAEHEAPTCDIPGRVYKTCTVCGERVLVDVELNAILHSMGSWESLGKATCTEGGRMRRECLREGCDYVEDVTIQPLGHRYANGDCTKLRTCVYCGQTVPGDVQPAHDLPDEWTYRDASFHQKACRNPGCSYVLIAAHTVGSNGDCTAEGGSYCLDCNFSTGHRTQHDFTGEYVSNNDGTHVRRCKNPGCTVTSTVEKCTAPHDDGNCMTALACACGYVIKPAAEDHSLVIKSNSKAGHVWECSDPYCFYVTPLETHRPVDDDSDCTTASKCMHCDYQLGNAYPNHTFGRFAQYHYDETGHWRVCSNPGCTAREKVLPHSTDYTYGVETKPATCTEDGYTKIIKYCTVCSYVIDTTTTIYPKLDHVWGEWQIVDTAGCEDTGVRERTCEVCGIEEVDNLDAKGHDWEDTITVDQEATCTVDGSSSRHCKNCDARTDIETIHASHSWDETRIKLPASCDTAGTGERICSKCGEVEEYVIDELGHSWNSEPTVDVAPNCETPGSESIHCSVCGLTKESTVIPATGHDWTEWQRVSTPDCDDSGVERRSCKVCSEIETKNLNPTGHAWESFYTIDKPASCTEDGSESIHCANCDAVKDSRIIKARGHEYGEWEQINSPSCGGEHSERRVCRICKYQQTTNVVTTDHHWASDFTIDMLPTCTENGSMSIHCLYCDAVAESTVIATDGHDWNNWETIPSACGSDMHRRVCAECGYTDTRNVAGVEHNWEEGYTVDKAATCTEDGSRSIHCADCDAVKNSEVIQATSHTLGEWETVDSPACDAEGSLKRTCSVCGYIETRNVVASGHRWADKYTVVKPATCTEDGSEELICTVCGTVGDSRIIPPNGHSFGGWSTVAEAGCETSGREQRTCEVCGHIEYKTTEPTGHIWAKVYTVDVEATCTTEGSESYHCLNAGCKATTGTRTIPAKDHTWGEWQIIDTAGCEDPGAQERRCDVCGQTETKNIDASAHSWSADYIVDKPATCTEDGSESIHCENCGATKESRVINATGHSFTKYDVTQPPTCTAEGVETAKCDVCGAVDTRNVAAAGHKWEEEYTVDTAATCTEDGSMSIHCSVCEAVQTSVTLPATGHSYENYRVTKNPTCTEHGTRTAECENGCGSVDEQIIAMLDHTFLEKDYKPHAAATCHSDATEAAYCANGCGMLNVRHVPNSRLEHTYKEGKCTVCGAVKPIVPGDGDADGDGKVSTSDALLTLRKVLGIVFMQSEQIMSADMNSDGIIDMRDALCILRIAIRVDMP